MSELKSYNISAMDWRGALLRNQSKTRIVIFAFVFIYMCIGLMIDTYFNVSLLPQIQSGLPREAYSQLYAHSTSYSYSYSPYSSPGSSFAVSWSQIQMVFIQLITLKIIPIATLLMMGIALISLLITHFFHKNLVMMGTDYHEVTSTVFKAESVAERQLYNVVEEMKIAAGIKYMPKVYIIEAII